MEIVGALLVPILVEAGRQLWTAYVKRLAERAGGDLADLSLSAMKGLAARIWSGQEPSAKLAELEALVRDAARKEGLTPADVETLVAKLHDPKVPQQFGNA